jgi:uncharacterized cupin superfamily protein
VAVPEASLRSTKYGLAPDGEGWFVLNARESRWRDYGPLGIACDFEGKRRFSHLGINLNIQGPGQPMTKYHRERAQEAFLVLAGDCVLVVDGEERPLAAWDFFHCPGGTEHAIVGAGEPHAVVLAVGARGGRKGIVYPDDRVAARHGASGEQPTTRPVRAAYLDGWLPDYGPSTARSRAETAARGDGWFVGNVRDLPWVRSDHFGAACIFEDGETDFPDLGFTLGVLQPGQPSGLYHAEANQEDFLVLTGECLALVEGSERPLRAWDLLHCPPGTEHILVGAGDGPCTVFMAGSRRGWPEKGIVYPSSALARRHGAGAEAETSTPSEAYAPFPKWQPAKPLLRGMPWARSA